MAYELNRYGMLLERTSMNLQRSGPVNCDGWAYYCPPGLALGSWQRTKTWRIKGYTVGSIKASPGTPCDDATPYLGFMVPWDGTFIASTATVPKNFLVFWPNPANFYYIDLASQPRSLANGSPFFYSWLYLTKNPGVGNCSGTVCRWVLNVACNCLGSSCPTTLWHGEMTAAPGFDPSGVYTRTGGIAANPETTKEIEMV